MSQESIQGEVLRITYRNDSNSWSVLRMRIQGMREQQTLVGITNAQVGQSLSATGKWVIRNGERQFHGEQITASNPATKEGIAAYLGSGMIPGIGPKKAEQMVAHFGDSILEVMDKEPARLREIKGFGAATIAKITKGWQEQKAISHIMVFLHSHNISAALCKRIYRAYGDEAIATIQADPFRLCFEVRGIGFKTADAIARQLAIPHDSPQRVLAGLKHLIGEAITQGHCGQSRPELLAAAEESLEVTADVAAKVLDANLQEQDGRKALFAQHDGIIYPRWLSDAEKRIAEVLRARAELSAPWARVSDALIERAQERMGMRLANKQMQAVRMALSRRVSVITGGPGVGKTSTLRVLLDVMRELKLNIAIAAPTGKAAQRASEATGMAASTIHRLLGLKGPDSKPTGEVQADVIVIDEFSMVDTPLMHQIVRAWGAKTALILVGDVDQLPSVGPGQVLADIIRSGVVPVTVLDEVFRQAAGSLIIRNAHAINAGRQPETGDKSDDFFILTEASVPSLRSAMETQPEDAIPAAVADACAQVIVDLVSTRLPRRYGFDPIADIQVLCPMNKGAAGVLAMNEGLQARLNPNPQAFVTRFGVRFGVGDKVIQTRNNYDLEIFNGDMGIVASVDQEESQVVVLFGARHVPVSFDDLDDLRLAYAMTIHKSQGSQAPAIIIPLVTQHWTMLQRNLLYTGVTRAQKLVVLVGQQRALAAAVRNKSAAQRITRLRDLLKAPGPVGIPSGLFEEEFFL